MICPGCNVKVPAGSQRCTVCRANVGGAATKLAFPARGLAAHDVGADPQNRLGPMSEFQVDYEAVP